MSNNYPAIGDVKLTPHEKFKENEMDKFDLINTDSLVIVDLIQHPNLEAYTEKQYEYSETFSVDGNLNVSGCVYSNKDNYFVGSDGYIYKYDHDWNLLSTIPASYDKTTYVRGITEIASEPDYYFIVSGGSARTVWKQNKSDNSYSIRTYLGYDVRGMTSIGDELFIGDTSKKTVKVYSSSLAYRRSYLLDISIEALLATGDGILVGNSSGLWLFDTSFNFIRMVYTGPISKGLAHIGGDLGEGLFKSYNGINIVTYLSVNTLPIINSESSDIPYKIVANLTEGE